MAAQDFDMNGVKAKEFEIYSALKPCEIFCNSNSLVPEREREKKIDTSILVIRERGFLARRKGLWR